MPKYTVELSAKIFITATVEADSPEEAEDIARDIGTVSSYCGNGGFDKMVGVDHPDVSICTNDDLDTESIEEV